MNRIRIVLFGAALAVAVTGSSVIPVEAGETIVISNWDAYMPPDLLEKFTAETGIKVEMSIHAINEEIMGKVTANGGRGYDLLFVSGPYVEALAKLGLIDKLDHRMLPNLQNLYAEARQLPFDPGNAYSVPYTWGTTGLCYRSDLVETEPTSWDSLLKPSDDLKGKVTMVSAERWLLGAGLKYLGYSLNTTNVDEIDAAKRLLIEAKHDLLAYDDTTFYAKLVSGEASLVQAWDGWCNLGIAENKDIKFVIPKEGSDLWVDAMVVTSVSEHKAAAHSFIDFVLRAENHASVMEFTLYKVPNEAAVARVDPALLQAYSPLAISSQTLFAQEQLRDLGDVQKEYTRAATEIMAAQ